MAEDPLAKGESCTSDIRPRNRIGRFSSRINGRGRQMVLAEASLSKCAQGKEERDGGSAVAVLQMRMTRASGTNAGATLQANCCKVWQSKEDMRSSAETIIWDGPDTSPWGIFNVLQTLPFLVTNVLQKTARFLICRHRRVEVIWPGCSVF